MAEREDTYDRHEYERNGRNRQNKENQDDYSWYNPRRWTWGDSKNQQQEEKSADDKITDTLKGIG